MSNTNMLSRSSIQIGGDATAATDNINTSSASSLGGVTVREDLSSVTSTAGASDGTKGNKVAIRPKTVNFTSVVDTTLLNTPSLLTSCALTPSMFTGSGLTTPLTFLSNGSFTFGGTPLLYSPATYANLEQTLLQLERQQTNVSAAQTAVNLSKEGSSSVVDPGAGPILGPASSAPPLTIMAPTTVSIKREHEPDTDDSDDESTSERDWSNSMTNPSSRRKTGREGAVDYSVTSPGYSSTDSGAANTSVNSGSGSTRRATGPRRSRNHIKLTPEEEERRNVRRERNKHAAAKCRQKRVDQTNQLLEETQGLEEEQNRLREEIKTFQQEKEELEFILEAHRLHCGVGNNNNDQNSGSSSGTTNHVATYNLPEVRINDTAPAVAPSTISYQGDAGPSTTSSGGAVGAAAAYAVSQGQVTMMNNVPLMTTPSGEMYILGFDSMMNGGQARLTPISVKPEGSPTHHGSTVVGQSVVVAGLQQIVQNLSNKNFQSEEMLNGFST